MNQPTKKVSIVIPAYNCEQYVKQAIDSILNQTHSNIQVLVADDASSDGTKAIIDSYTDRRVERFHNSVNLGYTKTVNKLFPLCNGDYIGFQDADDWSDEKRIEKQLDAFDQEGTDICGTGIYFVSADGQSPRKQLYPKSHDEIVEHIVRGEVDCCHATLLFHRSVLTRIGGYREFFIYGAEDVDWFYRSLEYFQCTNLAAPLYYYRFASDSITRNVNILKQQASIQLAKKLAEERTDTGSDMLSRGDIKSATILWKKYHDLLSVQPYNELIFKQDLLLRRKAFTEYIKLWSEIIKKNDINISTINIALVGLLKLLLGVDRYRQIRNQMVTVLSSGFGNYRNIIRKFKLL